MPLDGFGTSSKNLAAFDEIAHSYTSFAVTLTLAVIAYRRADRHFSQHRGDLFIVALAFGLALGALWEVFEWVVLPGDFKDSPVSDLVYDGIGSMFAAAISVWAAPKMRPRETSGSSANVV